MQIETRNRADLKSYFVKNSIPTESNFAELIDGMLNQADDGIAKPPGGPLSLRAEGNEASDKPALNLYQNFATGTDPDWTISLSPHEGSNAKRGLSIGETTDNSRLFIEHGSGQVGIGTISPGARLHIVHKNQDPNGNALVIGPKDQSNLRLGYDANYSWIQSHGAKPLAINSIGNGVGIGIADPDAKLDVKATGASVIFQARSNNNTVRFAVKNNGQVYATNNVGVGNTNPSQKLVVEGNLGAGKDSRNGMRNGASLALVGNAPSIDFVDTEHPDWQLHVNSGRMYFIRQGNNGWTYDNLVLWETGNVGIGHWGNAPSQKLSVNGFVAAEHVYYSAYVASNNLTNDRNPLPMAASSNNVGNGYDRNSSKFTVPVTGIYLFTMTGFRVDANAGGGWLLWRLMVDNSAVNQHGNGGEKTERSLLSWAPNFVGQATRTLLVNLTKGQKIHVQQSGIGRVDNYRSGVEGVLLWATR